MDLKEPSAPTIYQEATYKEAYDKAAYDKEKEDCGYDGDNVDPCKRAHFTPQFDQWALDWRTNAARLSSYAYDQACIRSETFSELKEIIYAVDNDRDLSKLPPTWIPNDAIIHTQTKLESLCYRLKQWRYEHNKLKKKVDFAEYLYSDCKCPIGKIDFRKQLTEAKHQLTRHESSDPELSASGNIEKYISESMDQTNQYDESTQALLTQLAACGCNQKLSFGFVLAPAHVQTSVGIINYIEKLMRTINDLIIQQITKRQQDIMMAAHIRQEEALGTNTDLVTTTTTTIIDPKHKDRYASVYKTKPQSVVASIPMAVHSLSTLFVKSTFNTSVNIQDTKPKATVLFQRYKLMREYANAVHNSASIVESESAEARLTCLVIHLSALVHTIPLVRQCINNYLNDQVNHDNLELYRTALVAATTKVVPKSNPPTSTLRIRQSPPAIDRRLMETSAPVRGSSLRLRRADNHVFPSPSEMVINKSGGSSSIASIPPPNHLPPTTASTASTSWWPWATTTTTITPTNTATASSSSTSTTSAVTTSTTSSTSTAVDFPGDFPGGRVDLYKSVVNTNTPADSDETTMVMIPSNAEELPIGDLDPFIDYVYMLWYEGYTNRTYTATPPSL